jgi:hypothetical protein
MQLSIASLLALLATGSTVLAFPFEGAKDGLIEARGCNAAILPICGGESFVAAHDCICKGQAAPCSAFSCPGDPPHNLVRVPRVTCALLFYIR